MSTRKHGKKSDSKTRKRSKAIVKRIPKSLFQKLNALSPFELNYKLIKMAGPNALNAGRGNPNFYNAFCRKVFAELQQAAMSISTPITSDVATYPVEGEHNYYQALIKQSSKWGEKKSSFFKGYLKYLAKRAREEKQDVETIMLDVVKSALGCFYPVPPQIQPHLSLVAQEFLYDLVMAAAVGNEPGAKMKPEDFECFATEGAAAGILYVFNTLKENYILLPKDKIALITPIFSPYLEMPRLSDYDLEIVELKCNPDNNYSLDDSEIDKLKDKSIKALFMVNPANPAAFSLSKKNIDRIGHIVNTERKDLIVLSDNVYAPFADQYNSFMLSCPRNTIEVYSLSKYFGTTGWRLGLCMVAKNNRINDILKGLPQKYKKALDKRYETATLDPSKLTFMDRLVFDSRQVAEAHVGGLSTPQQTLMAIMLYYDINDRKNGEPYRNTIKGILRKRIKSFYAELKTDIEIKPTMTDYYNLINIPEVTRNMYGEKAANYLVHEYEYLEFLFHLVSKYHTILLPGSGFGATPWRLRISLANLNEKDYIDIGKNIRLAIRDLVAPVLN
jgi:aspartate 4-decarboxylase